MPFTTSELFAHFDRIADAPDAIPRLRQLIIDLAMRGKLLEQESNAKHELNDYLPQEGETYPYALPLSWKWAKLGDLVKFIGGSQPPKSTFIFEPREGYTRLVQIRDFKSDTHPTYVPTSMANRPFKSDDIMIGRYGPPVFQILRGLEGTYNVALIKTELTSNALARDYLFYLLQESRIHNRVVKESERTAGQTGIRLPLLVSFIVAVPPLAEQHRIVAKVDELMALCDRLEAAQAERERRRDRLAAASLHRLNNGADGSDFREHARFHLDHLARFTTRPDQMPALRQTILNLAVRGKLVPQDPDDEPATELLKRIQVEKERLIAANVIKRQPPQTPVKDAQLSFQLPDSWRCVRFGELITDADAGWSPKSEGFPKSGDNWGVLKVSAVSWDKFLPEENKQLLPGVKPPEAAIVRKDDFLISRANTSELVAKCVIVEEQPQNLILSDKIVRLQIVANCNKKFLCIVNNHAEHARSYYAEEASGTSLSMKNVSRAVIYALAIPLPPLAEQQRIVAKVEELLALCDQLEAQLTNTQTERRRLLESVLHEALAPTAS